MPKMFSANPRVSRTDNSKISSSSNNKMITRSARLSQLAKSSKFSVNRTLANTFGPTNIYLSSYTLLVNVPIGTEIARISSKDINSFSFIYTLDDTSLFYIEGDKLYTNVVFPNTSNYDGLHIRITTNDGTYKFSKTVFISVPSPPVVNIIQNPVVINIDETSNTFNLSNTFLDTNNNTLTITAISDNPELVTANVDGYELITTYNNNISGSSIITLIAYNTYNVFVITRFSIIILRNDIDYNVIVNEIPANLPEPIDIIIDGVPISYIQLDNTYVNIVIDNINNATEDEKRDNVKSNISSIITKYNITSIDGVESDLYIPIDALPFPQLASNIDNIRIIDGSTSTSENPLSVNLTDNLENSAMYVNTTPGNKVIVNLENDILTIEQTAKYIFNVSINGGDVLTKSAGDIITMPASEIVITLSSIIIAENHAPVAYDINYTTRLNSIQNVIELNGYDVDINETSSNYIQYVIDTLPQNGELDVLQNTDLMSKLVKYTPFENYLGPDTFSYYVKDNYGIISNAATANVTVILDNSPATGTLTMTGTVEEGGILQYTSIITDMDGELTFEYQWQISNDNINWDNIAGATGTSYNIPSDQSLVDKYIKVTVVATDIYDGITNFSSQSTQIQNVNDEPTGQLGLSGLLMESRTVSADTTTITDEDGVLTYTYQWELSDDNLTWTIISGETNQSYTIPNDQGFVGKYIRVTAQSTDPYNNQQSYISTSGEITILDNPPTDIQLSGTEIYEGYAIGHEIGTITSSDEDSTNFTYEIDNNLFSLNNDRLISNHVFSYGSTNTYTVNITTTDETLSVFTKAFVITVKRLWVYTTLSSTEIAIGNNTTDLANGTTLGTNLTGSIIIPSTIDDINGNTYNVTNIYHNAFTGSSLEKITFSGDTTYTLDIPLKEVFRIVQTSEGYVLHQLNIPISGETVITNDDPTDIQLSGTEIYEGYEIGQEIGTLTSSDEDSTSFTYEIDSNLFSLNNDKLISNHVFSYGSTNTYTVNITTTNEKLNSFTKAFVITVKRLWVYTILSSTEIAIGNNTTDLANGTTLGTNLTGSIIIPSTIDDINGDTYNVTNIYQNAFTGSGVEKIQFAGDSIYTLDIPLKEVFQTDEEDILHQLEEV